MTFKICVLPSIDSNIVALTIHNLPTHIFTIVRQQQEVVIDTWNYFVYIQQKKKFKKKINKLKTITCARYTKDTHLNKLDTQKSRWHCIQFKRLWICYKKIYFFSVSFSKIDEEETIIYTILMYISVWFTKTKLRNDYIYIWYCVWHQTTDLCDVKSQQTFGFFFYTEIFVGHNNWQYSSSSYSK